MIQLNRPTHLTSHRPGAEVTSDGVTVWVNGINGALARFGQSGIDVHSADTTSCIYCTHKPPTAQDWETFKAKVWEHHGVDVSDDHKPARFIQFERYKVVSAYQKWEEAYRGANKGLRDCMLDAWYVAGEMVQADPQYAFVGASSVAGGVQRLHRQATLALGIWEKIHA